MSTEVDTTLQLIESSAKLTRRAATTGIESTPFQEALTILMSRVSDLMDSYGAAVLDLASPGGQDGDPMVGDGLTLGERLLSQDEVYQSFRELRERWVACQALSLPQPSGGEGELRRGFHRSSPSVVGQDAATSCASETTVGESAVTGAGSSPACACGGGCRSGAPLPGASDHGAGPCTMRRLYGHCPMHDGRAWA